MLLTSITMEGTYINIGEQPTRRDTEIVFAAYSGDRDAGPWLPDSIVDGNKQTVHEDALTGGGFPLLYYYNNSFIFL